MIPGSLDWGEPLGIRNVLRSFRSRVKRYIWLWIAYQAIKGITTMTLIWAPLIYLYLLS